MPKFEDTPVSGRDVARGWAMVNLPPEQIRNEAVAELGNVIEDYVVGRVQERLKDLFTPEERVEIGRALGEAIGCAGWQGKNHCTGCCMDASAILRYEPFSFRIVEIEAVHSKALEILKRRST